MSVHSSLRTAKGSLSALRNVMKRHERVRHLIMQGLWTEGRSVLGLPKIKQMKMKARKAAAKDKEDTAAAEQPAQPAPAASGGPTR